MKSKPRANESKVCSSFRLSSSLLPPPRLLLFLLLFSPSEALFFLEPANSSPLVSLHLVKMPQKRLFGTTGSEMGQKKRGRLC